MEADGFVTRDRQRPRHPGRSASEIPEKVRARSDHVHAARGRQIRLQGLRDLGRPARRRRLGRERALGAASRSRSWRGQEHFRQVFERGIPKGKLEKLGRVPNKRGTKVRFHPDAQIFGAKAAFKPARIFKMARSKAYLFGGVEIHWKCAKELLRGVDDVPEQETFHFERGLTDYLTAALHGTTLVHPDIFAGKVGKTGSHGAVEWAVAWVADADGFVSSYCNTIPTHDGGTHEAGPARRADARPARSRRARRPGQARRQRHAGRRDDRRRLHALGVHPRAGIPGPDQGPPRDRRGAAHHRAGDQGQCRSLARRQSRTRRTSCSTG